MSGELLIGLAGRARVGKDTAAAFLEHRYGLELMRFADPIKQATKDLFYLNHHHLDGTLKEQALPFIDKSPRELFQSLGQWGRDHVHPDLWVHLARLRLMHYRELYGENGAQLIGALWVDVRLESEAEWIRREGGLVIHIHRPGAPAVAGDVTEAGVEHRPGDALVTNDRDLGTLYHKLTDIVDGFIDESTLFNGGV